MGKEIYVKWNNDSQSQGGIFKISTQFDTISYDIVSGSTVSFWDLMGFLWNSDIMSEIRESIKRLSRKGNWRVKSRTGLSGCTDWYIQYEKQGLVKNTRALHCSMADKANEPFTLWMKDLYDILWWMSYKGTPIEDTSEVVFTDITEEVISRRKEFEENSLPSICGFGGKTLEQVLVDEDALYS